LYPARPEPPVSVDALQLRLIWLEEITLAVSPVGTLGAVVSPAVAVVVNDTSAP